MKKQPYPIRFTAIFLIVFLLSSVLVKAQTKDQLKAYPPEIRDYLVQRAKELKKEISDVSQYISKRQDELIKYRNKVGLEKSRNYTINTDYYVYRDVQTVIQNEIEIIKKIDELYFKREKPDDFSLASDTNDLIHYLDRRNSELPLFELEAFKQLRRAESDKDIDTFTVESVRKGYLSYRRIYEALDHQEATLNKFMFACCKTSIQERKQLWEQAKKERAEEQYQRSRAQQRASQYVDQMIIGFGTLAALVFVLQSKDSSPAQIDEAKTKIQALNDQARTNCILKGGTFYDGGQFAVGTCSK